MSTGGGFSRFFARPSYQSALKPIHHGRGVPDVAFDADPATGPAVAITTFGRNGQARGQLLTAGNGTSIATPAWAGIVALIDQAVGRRVGFINPWLYSVARSSAYARALHDIRVGDNGNQMALHVGPGLVIPRYRAARGWDAVTGLGTPNVAGLVELSRHSGVRP